MIRERKWVKVLLICLGALVILGAALFFTREKEEPMAPSVDEPPQMGIAELMDTAMTLKRDLKAVLSAVQEGDFAAAESQVTDLNQKVKSIRSLVTDMRSSLESIPSAAAKLDQLSNLLDLADLALGKVAVPVLAYAAEHPLSGLKGEEGIQVSLLWGYVDLAESLMPDVELLMDHLAGADLSAIDEDGKLTKLVDLGQGFVQLYREDHTILQKLKNFLGAQGERLYLMAAQNTAEIRASGGFPGAMGLLRITDGILILEDFETVNNMLPFRTPWDAQVTKQENRLFEKAMKNPRDADYCPDFERVGMIWAMAHEPHTGNHVDGVISMTPVLVQRVLAALDTEVTLFDGNVLNGSNGAQVLMHDIYFQYFGENRKDKYNVSDALFSEAARLTLDVVMSHLGVSDLLGYLDVAAESFRDRTLMIWLENEEEQAILRKLGWHGGLNQDPEKPQAGVYFNMTSACKMGWFVAIDTQLGERTANEDGSYTYPVTVTFNNLITPEERKIDSEYVIGDYHGVIVGSAYFFAPAGGTISGFQASNRAVISTDTYHDLDLGYTLGFLLRPEEPVVFTYQVTTAPGVEAELTFSKTPTTQGGQS